MRLPAFILTCVVSTSTLGQVVPSALLGVDQNRTTVVNRVVRDWGDAIQRSRAGIDSDQLREVLYGLRADQLLAASLAGTSEALLDVVTRGMQPSPDLGDKETVTKTLGSTSSDVTYTPINPCRLVDTRGSNSAVYQGSGPSHTSAPFAANEIRTYTLQGANGVCTSQLPSTLTPSAVQLQIFGMPTTAVSGDIEILPQGMAFGNTATMVYIASLAFNTVSTIARVNTTNKQISVQVRGGGAHVAIDVVGYFKAPSTPILPANSVTLSNLDASTVDTKYASKTFSGNILTSFMAAGGQATWTFTGTPIVPDIVWRVVPITIGGRMQIVSDDVELASDGTHTHYLVVRNTGAVGTNYEIHRLGLQ